MSTDPPASVPDALDVANRNVRLLLAVAVAANEASTLEQAVQSCLDAICDHGSWPVGHYYSCVGKNQLVPTAVWHLEDPERFDALRRVTDAVQVGAGHELFGRLLASRQPSWINGLSTDDGRVTARWTADLGLAAAFALPVLLGDEVLGVLEFFSLVPVDPEPALLEVMAQIGTVLGRVAERTQVALALEQSEERMRLVVETAGDAFIGMDESGLINGWNAAAEATLGWTHAEALGRRLADTIIPPRYREAHDLGVAHFLASGEAPVFGQRLELEALHRDGHEVPMELSIWPVRHGRSLHFNAFMHDISARRTTQWALREANERFQTTFDDAPIGMALTDPTGRFLQANRAYCELLGYTVHALSAMSLRDITPVEDFETSQELFRQVLTGEVRTHRSEGRYLHGDGHMVWVLLSVSGVASTEGRIAYLIGQIEDISERKMNEEKLTRQALHDPLTGLPNRLLLVDRLRQALARCERGDGSVTVMFLDLDHFKLINDSLGHDAGDQVLVDVARRMEHTLRPADTAARLGGDEFVILCEGLEDDGTARALATRLEAAVAAPCLVGQEEVSVSASIGVVMTTSASVSTSPESLLRDADAAMYMAKESGKARHEVLDEALRHRADERLRFELGLREALESGGLRLVYQPVVELTTNTVVGLEALLRYRDPERGLLEADQFIHVAEASGLVIPIGTWVMQQACTEAANWHSHGWPLPVVVNLGARQMAWANLPERIDDALDVAGLPAASLWLDLPETSIMHAAGSTIKTLSAVRRTGVRLGIGDLGSGDGSLGSLKRLAVDFVKLDRSIVAGIGSDPICTATAESLVAMGRAFGVTTVALAVETGEQLALLREMGCVLAQGNLFAAPQPPELLAATLAAGHTSVGDVHDGG